MNFKCQEEPIAELDKLAQAHRQSIIIEGARGNGKTYLSRQYAKMVGVLDFQLIEPKVDAIRSTIEECIKINQPVVICIENLDKGVQAASYALLKFLEEPPACAYIIITCQNIQMVPDTIVSRSNVVTLNPPIDSDLELYARDKYGSRYNEMERSALWSSVRAFQDVDLIMSFDSTKISYFNSLPEVCKFNDSVSNIIWKLGHFDDNSETPIEFVIRFIMNVIRTPFAERCGIECIRDLNQGRIASHAVLAKFVFNVKYCE